LPPRGNDGGGVGSNVGDDIRDGHGTPSGVESRNAGNSQGANAAAGLRRLQEHFGGVGLSIEGAWEAFLLFFLAVGGEKPGGFSSDESQTGGVPWARGLGGE